MPDEVGDLLLAVGAGDVDALAAFYEGTSLVVFNLLSSALGEPAAAERAMVRVYAHLWRTAPAFDRAAMSGCTFLMRVVRRELDGRRRCGDAQRGRSRRGGGAERLGGLLE